MKIKWTTLMILSILLCCETNAQKENDRWKSFIDLDHYLQPFWRSDTIYDEAVLPIKKNGEVRGKLLFPALKILSIKDAYLQKEYNRPEDWVWDKGRLKLPCTTTIPYFSSSELLFENKIGGVSMESKIKDHYILFSEGGLLQSRQVLVTYVKEKSAKWGGISPILAEKQIPNVLAKLSNKKPVKIIFFGNSIETGANSSSTLNQPPFLPTWPEMVIENLRKHYQGPVLYKNKSKGGMLANWGVSYADSLVSAENPNLVILGFGMNDGTFNVPVEIFRDQIKKIMQKIKTSNPECEFILITTMLANPEAIQSQIQMAYRQPLLNLAGQGIAIADMTSIHEELLKHKSYQDMTGNNVNHPNDYLARWYAQVISALLIK